MSKHSTSKDQNDFATDLKLASVDNTLCAILADSSHPARGFAKTEFDIAACHVCFQPIRRRGSQVRINIHPRQQLSRHKWIFEVRLVELFDNLLGDDSPALLYLSDRRREGVSA